MREKKLYDFMTWVTKQKTILRMKVLHDPDEAKEGKVPKEPMLFHRGTDNQANQKLVSNQIQRKLIN